MSRRPRPLLSAFPRREFPRSHRRGAEWFARISGGCLCGASKQTYH